jgi:hypothetical protein
MPCGVQWPLNHHWSHRDNYIFIYFGMPLKMNDISEFFIFIFIQIDISHKYKLHMQLQTILQSFMWLPILFTKCHKRWSYIKLQKWLIWTQVANTWVGMDKIHYSVDFDYFTLFVNYTLLIFGKGFIKKKYSKTIMIISPLKKKGFCNCLATQFFSYTGHLILTIFICNEC